MPVKLGEDKENEIQKNLKKYSKKFEAEDESLKSQADTEKLEERNKLESEWKAFTDRKAAEFETIKSEYLALVRLSGYVETDQEGEIEEVEVEEVISVKEEKM